MTRIPLQNKDDFEHLMVVTKADFLMTPQLIMHAAAN